MRHHKDSEGRNIGPVRRAFRGLFFLAAAPVFIGVGLILLPFMVVARLFGFRGPQGRFAKHGCGGRERRSSGDQQGGSVRDAGAVA